MLTTFDRYLLGRFLYVFFVFFIATYGLFVVIDCFTNVDSFQEGTDSPLETLHRIVLYYGFHVTEFFELAGPILSVIAVIVVLALLQKNAEVAPILAAGVPTFRLVLPLLIGTVLINAALMINQEFVIPSFAYQLQIPRGELKGSEERVRPSYDHVNYLMHVDGRSIDVANRRLVDAAITLPAPALVRRTTTVETEEAIYYVRTENRPGGWLLKDVGEQFDADLLTAEGRQLVHPQRASEDVFVVSAVTPGQLYNSGGTTKYLSSTQLLEQIREPAMGLLPVRGQSMQLHFRFTRPLINLCMVFAVMPLVIRRESRSLITNMAVCAMVMSSLYVISQGFMYLGGTSLLAPDLAAWLPVMISGAVAAWVGSWIQT